MALNWNCFKK